MKRIITAVLCLVFMLSAVSVSAEVPEYLLEEYTNYTADYSVSVSFESSEELVALLEELEMPEEINNYVDIKSLLKSILSQNTNMNLQLDVAEDFRSGEYALTADCDYFVDVNTNLKMNFDMKLGMWMKYDLDAETPVFEIIYSYPYFNKYMVIDVLSMMQDEEKAEFLAMMDRIFGQEFMEFSRQITKTMFEKYAQIRVEGAGCTVKFDNDALVGMLGEMIPAVLEKTYGLMSGQIAEEAAEETAEPEQAELEGVKAEELLPEIDNEAESLGIIGGADGPTAIFVAPEAENDFLMASLPDLSGIKILGEEGISFKYSLFGGKVSKADMKADISLDISNIFEQLSGETWQYQEKGVLDFVLEASVKLSKIGKTKVQLPVLTEENSFNIQELMPEEDFSGEYIEEETEYPYFYVWTEWEEPYRAGEELYVPLRAVLENGYDDQVAIEYKDGVVTATSKYFPAFEKITLRIDSEEVYTDQASHKCAKVILKNGKTYVSKAFFEELFGWELGEASYDILSNSYRVGFYTY